jgi:hypothetical protein
MSSSAQAHGRGSRIDYDGRRFRPVEAGPADGGADTAVGHYHQDSDLVWAQFAGSGVRSGWLVGTCRPDGVIDAAYCMVTSDGDAIAGNCESTPTLMADGRVQLTEHWRRQDGSAGISQLEEIAE